VEHNELILKMYTVLGFEIVFQQIIEENWKKFCVEISFSFQVMLLYPFHDNKVKFNILN